MMPSSSLPVALSSACSVMDTTRMPLRRSWALNATACSRFLVKRLNFQTRMTSKGAFALLPSSIIFRNWGRSAMRPLSGLVHVLTGYGVAVGLGVLPQRPKLRSDGEVHVPGGHWRLSRRVPPGSGVGTAAFSSYVLPSFVVAYDYPVLLSIMKHPSGICQEATVSGRGGSAAQPITGTARYRNRPYALPGNIENSRQRS